MITSTTSKLIMQFFFDRKFFTKVDIVFNAINDSSIPSDVPMNNLWERYSKCIVNMDDDCRLLGRKAWKHFFGSLSIILENIATDLLTYFTEVNGNDALLLQFRGIKLPLSQLVRG